MSAAITTRFSFLAAVALIAAAVADPVVESIANSGILGGRYEDNNHLFVTPVLLIGGAFILRVLTLRCLDVWRSTSGSRNWLVDVAKEFSERSTLQDLPYVFGMQLAALFLMESAEQLAVGGRLLGGTAWLGGPILFSLLAHAMVGAVCLCALESFLRALLRTFASFVRSVIEFIWLAISRADGGIRFGRREAPNLLAQSVHVHQVGGRAPPLLRTQGLSY